MTDRIPPSIEFRRNFMRYLSRQYEIPNRVDPPQASTPPGELLKEGQVFVAQAETLPPLPGVYAYQNPSPEQVQWQEKIENVVTFCRFASYQDYDLWREGNGPIQSQNKNYSFIYETWDMKNRPPVLSKWFSDFKLYSQDHGGLFHKKKSGSYRIYAGLYMAKGGNPVVLGAGGIHLENGGRPGMVAFLLQFTSVASAREFLTQLENNPRLGIEYYFQTKFENNLPQRGCEKSHETEARYYRSPFTELSVPVNVYTKDTLIK